MSACQLCRRATETLICDYHVGRLAELLDPRQDGDVFVKPGERRVAPSIPVLYGLLSTHRGVHGPMAVGHDALGPRSPADDATLVLRDRRSRAAISGPDDRERQPDAPLAVLSHLAGRALEVRPPEREPAWTIVGLSSYLHGQVDWIARQSWCVSAYVQLQGVHRSLRAAVGDPAPGSVGRCWVLVNDDGRPDEEGGWRCDTPLYMPEQAPRAPDEPLVLPAIRCSGCGWHYTGAELVQLGREVERAS